MLRRVAAIARTNAAVANVRVAVVVAIAAAVGMTHHLLGGGMFTSHKRGEKCPEYQLDRLNAFRRMLGLPEWQPVRSSLASSRRRQRSRS